MQECGKWYFETSVFWGQGKTQVWQLELPIFFWYWTKFGKVGSGKGVEDSTWIPCGFSGGPGTGRKCQASPSSAWFGFLFHLLQLRNAIDVIFLVLTKPQSCHWWHHRVPSPCKKMCGTMWYAFVIDHGNVLGSMLVCRKLHTTRSFEVLGTPNNWHKGLAWPK